MATESGSAIFRAIADFTALRREAKRAADGLKDTRSAARDTNREIGDLEQNSNRTADSLDNVGKSARKSNTDLKGLLSSVRDWAKTKAKAVLDVDARKAKLEIQQLKSDLAGFRVTTLQIDAKTAEAKRDLDIVKAELAELRAQPKSADVDLHIDGALAKIKILEARLASLRDERVKVDADTAGARAKLATIERQADQVGRKRPTIKVDVDSSKARTLGTVLAAIGAGAALLGPVVGALAAIAAGLFAVGSAAAPAVAGLAGLIAIAGAAAQAVGVLAIALSGVGGAFKALQTRQNAAGSSATSSAKTQEAAATRIRSAQESVDRAVEQRTRTFIQSDQQVKAAEAAVASAVESAARRVAAAERQYTDAVKEATRAQDDLNAAREEAVTRLRDLDDQVRSGSLDEEAAAIRVERARNELQAAQQAGASGLDLAEADLAYRQAQENLLELQHHNEDLAKKQQYAAQTGVEGDQQVIDAHDRLDAATQAVSDSEDELTQARKDAAKEVSDAQLALSQTIQQTSWANADAERAVTDAVRALGEAQRAAGDDAATAGGKAADAFDQASPAAQRFAQFLFNEVLPALHRIRDEVQERALPKLETAIRTLLPLTDLFADKLGNTADILGDAAIKGANMVSSGPWTRDFGTILDSNNRIIGTLADTTLTAMDALRILWVTAGPLAERLALLIQHGIELTRNWLEAKRSTGELADFMDHAGNVIVQLTHIIGNLLVGIVNAGKAAAPAGQQLLDSFEKATQRFREFTGSAEGQNKMRDYFLGIVPVVQEFGSLIVDLITFIGRLGNNSDLAPLIAKIRTEFLPALEGLVHTMGEGVLPRFVDFGTKIADVITKLGGGWLEGFLVTLNAVLDVLNAILSIPGFGEFIGYLLAIAGAGKALGITAGAIKGVAEGLKILGPALDIVTWAVKGLGAALLANPILAIIAAIALAALLIYENWDTIKAWWTDTLWPAIKGAAEAVWNFLTDLFSAPEQPEAVRQFGEKVKTHFNEFTTYCQDKLGQFWDWANGKVADADRSINDTIAGMAQGIREKWDAGWDAAKNTLSGAWDFINGTSDDRSRILRGILQTIGDKLGIDLAGAWDAAGRKVADVWGAITRTIDNAIAWIERQIARIEAAWDRLKADVSSGLSTAASYIPGFATGGMVGGTGNGDNQIIRATAGEWIVPKDITARWLPFLKAITYGSLRATAQTIDPATTRIIEQRLAGVPDFSALAGLREVVPTIQGANTSTNNNTTTATKAMQITTNIYNPVAEPGSDSVANRMRTLSQLGAFS